MTPALMAILFVGLASFVFVRYGRPAHLYRVRDLVIAARNNIAWVEADEFGKPTELTQLQIARASLRYESHMSAEDALNRIPQVRRLYHMFDPIRGTEPVDDVAGTSIVLVELANQIETLARRKIGKTGLEHPVVYADEILADLLAAIDTRVREDELETESPGSLPFGMSTEERLRQSPLSVEQLAEMLIAVLIAAGHRVLSTEPASAE